MPNPIFFSTCIGSQESLLEYQDTIEQILEGRLTRGLHFEKLHGADVYSARINQKGRLLFTRQYIDGEQALIFLMALPNHDYPTQAELQRLEALGFEIAETRFEDADIGILESTSNVQAGSSSDKPVSSSIGYELVDLMVYDQRLIKLTLEQEVILQKPLPVVIQGAAGSGKTCVAVKVMSSLKDAVESGQQVLYVAPTKELAESVRKIAHASLGELSEQISFQSIDELMTGFYPVDFAGVGFDAFASWYQDYAKANRRDLSKSLTTKLTPAKLKSLYEEFQVISGYELESDYLSLGQKQSLYDAQIRPQLWQAYAAYQTHLEENAQYDKWFVSKAILAADDNPPVVIVDEAQNFSLSSLEWLQALSANQVCLLMDSNQQKGTVSCYEYAQTHLNIESECLTANFRCPPQVMDFASTVLDLKKKLFKKQKIEAVQSRAASTTEGFVHLLSKSEETDEMHRVFELAKTPKLAVITPAHLVDEARARFDTELVLTPEQAAGLQYPYVVLYEPYMTESFRKMNKHLQSGQEMAPVDSVAVESALKMHYVAVTRAQKGLWVCGTPNQHHTKHIYQALGPKTEKVEQKAQQHAVQQIESKPLSKKDWAKELKTQIDKGNMDVAERIFNKHIKQVGQTFNTYVNILKPTKTVEIGEQSTASSVNSKLSMQKGKQEESMPETDSADRNEGLISFDVKIQKTIPHLKQSALSLEASDQGEDIDNQKTGSSLKFTPKKVKPTSASKRAIKGLFKGLRDENKQLIEKFLNRKDAKELLLFHEYNGQNVFKTIAEHQKPEVGDFWLQMLISLMADIKRNSSKHTSSLLDREFLLMPIDNGQTVIDYLLKGSDITLKLLTFLDIDELINIGDLLEHASEPAVKNLLMNPNALNLLYESFEGLGKDELSKEHLLKLLQLMEKFYDADDEHIKVKLIQFISTKYTTNQSWIYVITYLFLSQKKTDNWNFNFQNFVKHLPSLVLSSFFMFSEKEGSVLFEMIQNSPTEMPAQNLEFVLELCLESMNLFFSSEEGIIDLSKSRRIINFFEGLVSHFGIELVASAVLDIITTKKDAVFNFAFLQFHLPNVPDQVTNYIIENFTLPFINSEQLCFPCNLKINEKDLHDFSVFYELSRHKPVYLLSLLTKNPEIIDGLSSEILNQSPYEVNASSTLPKRCPGLLVTLASKAIGRDILSLMLQNKNLCQGIRFESLFDICLAPPHVGTSGFIHLSKGGHGRQVLVQIFTENEELLEQITFKHLTTSHGQYKAPLYNMIQAEDRTLYDMLLMKRPDLKSEMIEYETKNIVERNPSLEFSEHRFFVIHQQLLKPFMSLIIMNLTTINHPHQAEVGKVSCFDKLIGHIDPAGKVVFLSSSVLICLMTHHPGMV